MTDSQDKNRSGTSLNIKFDLLSFLRYGLLVLLIGYITFLFMLKGDNNTPFSTVEKALNKQVQKTEQVKGNSKVLKRLYGLNAADYDGTMLRVTEGTMEVEELLVVKVKNDNQLQEVEKAVSNRLTQQKESFKGYGAEQTKLLNNAIVDIKGNYIFYVVSEKAQIYRKIFLDSL